MILLTSLFTFLLAGPAFLFQVQEPVRPALFREGAEAAGINFKHVSGSPEKRYILESMSGGVVVFDFDSDGWMDLFFANGNRWDDLLQGTRHVFGALYRNRRDGSFENVSAGSGLQGGLWDMGGVAGDADNDGDVDLLITGFGGLQLYLNEGGGKFRDATAGSGLESSDWSTGASFGDFDGDGLLDLAVVNYVVFDPAHPPSRTPLCNYRGIEVQCGPRGLPGTQDRLFRNLGGGRFADVTKEAGLVTPNLYYGLGCIWADYDNDGDQDLFVANDSCPNYLFRNQGGKFQEVAMESGVALDDDGHEQAGMGVAFADVDSDGFLDLLQTNFSDDNNTLYSNQGHFFLDASYGWGIAEVSWQYLGWGAVFLDANLDGYWDLFVANGHVYPEVDQVQIGTSYRQRDFLFLNQRGQRFTEVGEASGMSLKRSSRGAAAGDFNNDGKMDIVVSHLDETPGLYWNQSEVRNPWLGLDLRNRQGAPAVGARVTIVQGERRIMVDVGSGSSYLSHHDHRIVLGLESSAETRIEVRWPNGEKQVLSGWKVDQYNRFTGPPL